MSVTTKFPTTYEELADMGSGQVSFPASWEEYLDLLEKAEFRVEYDNNEIFTMGYTTLNHDLLVSELISLFKMIFDDANYFVLTGSRPVHIENERVYMPDVHVGNEKPKLLEYRKGLNAHLNPWIIVEVLSPSTESYDWITKLPNYKKIPSVQYIIYIRQNESYVSLFKRKDNGNVWENVDFSKLDETIEIEGKSFSLQELYRNILR